MNSWNAEVSNGAIPSFLSMSKLDTPCELSSLRTPPIILLILLGSYPWSCKLPKTETGAILGGALYASPTDVPTPGMFITKPSVDFSVGNGGIIESPQLWNQLYFGLPQSFVLPGVD